MGYCDWHKAPEIDRRYHGQEWGVPIRDDKKQFEYLMLEVMQCGLNWQLMLKKRQIFKQCFAGFDYDKVAAFGETEINKILQTENMIRSERKIRAVINNAKCFQKIRREFGSFSNYIWQFADNKTIIYQGHPEGRIPVSNGLSDIISKNLQKRGFKFVGSITVYSHLQACGIINDHSAECPRFAFINTNYPTQTLPPSAEKF